MFQSNYLKDYLDHQLTKVYNESAYWRRFYLKTSNLKGARHRSDTERGSEDEVQTHTYSRSNMLAVHKCHKSYYSCIPIIDTPFVKFRWVNLGYTSWDKKGKNLADSTVFFMKCVTSLSLPSLLPFSVDLRWPIAITASKEP